MTSSGVRKILSFTITTTLYVALVLYVQFCSWMLNRTLYGRWNAMLMGMTDSKAKCKVLKYYTEHAE